MAHGDPRVEVAAKTASQDLYWVIHRLLPGAMAWWLGHTDGDSTMLDAEISALA
jgi:hypothetical protein